jgi:hypothetical protein
MMSSFLSPSLVIVPRGDEIRANRWFFYLAGHLRDYDAVKVVTWSRIASCHLVVVRDTFGKIAG